MVPLTQFIHRKFLILDRDASALQAARAMCDNQIGCVLVGDREGNAVGILTDRDFACRWAVDHGGKDATIGQLMSSVVVVADEGSGLSDVVGLMERHGVRRIPIVRESGGGRKVFVGIVTLDDLQASRQIREDQVSRIIRRQLGRRMDAIGAHAPSTERARRRSDAHGRKALSEFHGFLAGATGLSRDVVPKVVRYVIGALLMRVTPTTASHLLAQLPREVREALSGLPAGPDRAYSAGKVLEELTARFGFPPEQARSVLHRVIYALKVPMGLQAMGHVESQLPDDFGPYFEPVSLDPLPSRREPELPAPAHHSFVDRTQAARELLRGLERYKGKNPLVLGVPRGSVPMARIIAEGLGGDLDVVLVHKIGAPENPEFAIGSVSEFGTIHPSGAVETYGIPKEYVDATGEGEILKLRQRRREYSPIRPPVDPRDRTVIVVDDGIATGSTMLAAIQAVRSQGARRVVVAAPVASPRVVPSLEAKADEVVVLETPEDFFAISQFYDDFPQVTDAEVVDALSKAGESRGGRAA